jgi:hypothetical protein
MFAAQLCITVGCAFVPVDSVVLAHPTWHGCGLCKHRNDNDLFFAEETISSVGSNVLQQYTLP